MSRDSASKILNKHISLRDARKILRSQQPYRTVNYGDAVNKEKLTHLTADQPARQIVHGKVPAGPDKQSILESAYRSQSSRIFKDKVFEQGERGLSVYDRLIPHQTLDNKGVNVGGYKMSDFGTRPEPPSTVDQFSVDSLRTSHVAHSMQTGLIGESSNTQIREVDANLRPKPIVSRYNGKRTMTGIYGANKRARY